MVKHLSDGDDSGTVFGQNATDLISFWGAAATAQPASIAIVTTTAAVSISATQWGFSTSTQANAITTWINTFHAHAVSVGLERN